MDPPYRRSIDASSSSAPKNASSPAEVIGRDGHLCVSSEFRRGFQTLRCRFGERRIARSQPHSSDEIPCRAVQSVFDASVGSPQAAKSSFRSQPDVKMAKLLFSYLDRSAFLAFVSRVGRTDGTKARRSDAIIVQARYRFRCENLTIERPRNRSSQ